MPLARLSRATVHYESIGEGPVLLGIMGFGVPLEGWAFQVRALAAGRRVVTFDNRGIGRSSVPALPWTTDALATDALELMDHLGIDRADLLGLSMGGMVSQRIALRAPERVRSMVLAASFAHADAALRLAVGRVTAMALRGWARTGFAGRAAFDLSLRRAWESHVVAEAELDSEQQALLDDTWALLGRLPRSDLGVLGQLTALLRHDARSELRHIRAPTLVVAGSTDALSPLHQARALARGIPGARLEILAGAPHGLNLAAAPLFNATVATFLERHSPLPAAQTAGAESSPRLLRGVAQRQA